MFNVPFFCNNIPFEYKAKIDIIQHTLNEIKKEPDIRVEVKKYPSPVEVKNEEVQVFIEVIEEPPVIEPKHDLVVIDEEETEPEKNYVINIY